MAHNINCKDPLGGWEFHFIICNKEWGYIVRIEEYNMKRFDAADYYRRLARNYWVLVDRHDPITHEYIETWDSAKRI